MKKYGFDIFKCVQKEEEAVSDMNPEIKAKIDRKKAKGYILGYLCYNLDYYNKGLST